MPQSSHDLLAPGAKKQEADGESTALLATGHTGFTSGNLRSITASAELP
jgi:hypothetical protein